MECSLILLLASLLLCTLTHRVAGGVCSSTCDCSMETVPLLSDTKSYFILDCTSDASDVANSSLADVFKYTQPDPFSVFDSNVFYDGFFNLKSLSVKGGIQGVTFIPRISSLRLLDISHISLSYLARYSLSKISDILLSVSLTKNQIEFLSEDSFEGLQSLLYLNLSRNRIETLPQTIFINMTNLKSLDLSKNFLTGVTSAVVSGMKSLVWMSLAGNRIHTLESVEFPNSGIEFIVANNPIDNITWIARREAKLTTLDISSNNIDVMKAMTLKKAYIEKLVMRNCQHLTIIYPGFFVNDTIKTIDFSNNRNLQHIDSLTFDNINGLREVHVDNNSLKIIPEAWSSVTSIELISAKGNPLVCDCNLFWVNVLSGTQARVYISPLSQLCGSDNVVLPRQCGPQMLYKSNRLISVDEGESTTLVCKVGGIPTAEVSWLHGGRPVPTGTNIKTLVGDLIISHARSANSGLYECLARNSRGYINETFNVTIIKDSARIIILNIGDDSVEFSWRISDPFKQYKAVLIDSTTNNQTTYAIKQFARSRHSQSGYTISNLKSDTTYSICLAFETQPLAESDRCETITTLRSSKKGNGGITDYSLYGIVIAAIISFIFILVIFCVCIASRRYSARKKKEDAMGMVSESSYGLMTTSFSQRSGISAMYDNAGVCVTPVNHLSRSSSYYKFKRNPTSHPATPSSPSVQFVPPQITELFPTTLKRTLSDPLL